MIQEIDAHQHASHSLLFKTQRYVKLLWIQITSLRVKGKKKIINFCPPQILIFPLISVWVHFKDSPISLGAFIYKLLSSPSNFTQLASPLYSDFPQIPFVTARYSRYSWTTFFRRAETSVYFEIAFWLHPSLLKINVSPMPKTNKDGSHCIDLSNKTSPQSAKLKPH